MSYFNFDGALFQLLYGLGLDLSSIENIEEMTPQDLFFIALIFAGCLLLVCLVLRGLFYCLRELTGSCLR